MKPYLIGCVLFLAGFTALGYFGNKDVILTAFAILLLLAILGGIAMGRKEK